MLELGWFFVVGLVVVFGACGLYMFGVAYRNRQRSHRRTALMLGVGLGAFFALISMLALVGLIVRGWVGEAAFLTIAALMVGYGLVLPVAGRILQRRNQWKRRAR